MEELKGLVPHMIDAINEISAISGYKGIVRKQCCNLVRRLKLLMPMFEEIRENEEVTEEGLRSLVMLLEGIDLAKDLLKFGSQASKIYLVMQGHEIVQRFSTVSAKLEQALSVVSFDKLGTPDEVREQVELVHSQFTRAKGFTEPPGRDLYKDLSSLCDVTDDVNVAPIAMRTLTEKLQLTTIADLKQESLALTELVAVQSKGHGEKIKLMFIVLNKFEDFLQTTNPETVNSVEDKCDSRNYNELSKNVEIPDDFRCPISLELMKDPVIVSTGQTYERSCIEKWLDAGHISCPKTQQALSNKVLTPNYVLRSLIAQWCEANGIDSPKCPTNSNPNRSSITCSPEEKEKIDILITKLQSGNLDNNQVAAFELRLLAKRNASNRIYIAKAGAIPYLINLLSSTDLETQEHAVTAILNLSICEENKRSIITSEDSITRIVHVLKCGNMKARENAAATLFSLSVVNENKIIIGSSEAIPELVILLREGSQQGKKDAATALFNLCIYQGNKAKAVRAGVVAILMKLLSEPGGQMADEALAILAILSSHPEGKSSIGSEDPIPVLVDVIRSGSPRNKENATAIMLHLCVTREHLTKARELGVMISLLDLAQNGTDRGKRKAAQLLERMCRVFEQEALVQAHTDPGI